MALGPMIVDLTGLTLTDEDCRRLANPMTGGVILFGRAIEEKLKPFGSRVKTLTVDNGQEFADHQTIDQTLEIQTYFADQSV